MEEKTKNSLRIHMGLVLAVLICVSGFTVEVFRAEAGNDLSWFYVFEWPLFAGYAVYMWRKLLQEVREGVAAAPDSPDNDVGLDEYNAYLRSVHQMTSTPTPSKSVRGAATKHQPTSRRRASATVKPGTTSSPTREGG